PMPSKIPLVMIIDDLEIGREVLQATLRGEAMRVETASSGEEGLQKAKLYRPDVILLDVMMPGMDGFEVCRRLRHDESTAEVPILLVTASDDRNARLRGLAVGADDFLARPLDMLELRARVRAICRLNRYRKIVEERARVGQLFEFAAHGIALIDTDLSIIAANPALRTLFRIQSGQRLIGESVLDWVVEGQRDEAGALMREAFEALSLVPHFEMAVLQSTGEVRMIDLTLGPCPWDGKTALQAFFRDITELRRAKEAAERLHRNDAVASSAFEIVHKFNNHLSVIAMNAELLDDDTGSAAAIREACEQTAQLSDRILAFAHRDRRTALAGLDVDRVLVEMAPSLESLMGSSHRLRVEAGVEGAVRGQADPDQLRDVILSLVMNARDAMADGGDIEIRTASKAGEVVVDVEDRGHGIAAERHDAIFEPFNTTKPGSTGLGLSTAMEFVTGWGGRLEVTSEPGQGATFHLTLRALPP
ncbi:MAG: hybrid sensor histidine kinase/response regulator, partial [Acidobacteriota bacterium]